MPVTLERNQTQWRIRLEGQVALGSAPELKRILVEWLAARVDLELDLEHAEGLDFTALQLLWAAGAESARQGLTIVARLSKAATIAVRQAGFDRMPALGDACREQ